MFNQPLAIIDVETTGTSGWYDRIIEVGLIRIENNKIVAKFETLINPETYVSPFIEQFTGINAKDLIKAPVFSDIKNDLFKLLDGAVFVAHNARFDYGFIKSEFKRHDMRYNAKTLCTVKLSRRLFPAVRHHNLSAIIERFNIDCKRRHRAFDDAKVVWHFIKGLNKHVSQNKLDEAISIVMKNSYSADPKIASQIQELPESAGVYLFYDEKDIPLYIGKSTNIKERVITHFSTDYQSTRQLSMTKNVSRIEHIQTAGELGALIQESRLIKELSPLYNRALRRKNEFVTVGKYTDSHGYHTLKLTLSKQVETSAFENLFGVFKNKKSAKEALSNLAKKYGLCNKILGIEKTHSSCFEHKLGRCRGACLGKEKPLTYNMRFSIAFIENKEFRRWPYQGAIELVEKNEEEELFETFTIDNWCLIKNIKQKGEILQTDSQVDFDIDSYKIINSFLKQKNKYPYRVL